MNMKVVAFITCVDHKYICKNGIRKQKGLPVYLLLTLQCLILNYCLLCPFLPGQFTGVITGTGMWLLLISHLFILQGTSS